MGLFWLEFGLMLYQRVGMDAISISSAALILVGFLVPAAFLLLYKSTAQQADKVDKLERDLHRFKANPAIMDALLKTEKEMPLVPQGMGVIELGNKNASNTLVVVTNPLCGWCGKMHKRINAILEEAENLRVQLILFTNPDGIDATERIGKTLLSLPKELQHTAIDAWFELESRNVEIWQQAFITYPEREVANVWIKEQREWANNAEARSTPTLFFNGYKMPAALQPEDLVEVCSNYAQARAISETS